MWLKGHSCTINNVVAVIHGRFSQDIQHIPLIQTPKNSFCSSIVPIVCLRTLPPLSMVRSRRGASTSEAEQERRALAEQKRRAFAEIFKRAPELGDALDEARGPCLKYQGRHPSGKRCNRGNDCAFLHVKKGQELKHAQNRLRAPFTHLTGENKIRVDPPLKQAVRYWWKHTMKQETDCPITAVDVLREGDSQVVLLTLNKPLPSSFALDSSAKSWFTTEDGTQINVSTAEIPQDRMWWHPADIECFGDILRDSLCTGPQGTFKGVYSYTGWEKCPAYAGRVVFGFRSEGMVTKLSAKCDVPEYIPEGVTGYFDSGDTRQWIHHPRNLQLMYARVDYATFCTLLSDAFENITDEHRYSLALHEALVKIAGLVVIPFDEQHEFDYDGPYGWTADPPVNKRGDYDKAKLEREYGVGCKMFSALSKGEDVDQLRKEWKEKSTFDMLRLWGRHASCFDCNGKKKKRKIHECDEVHRIALKREPGGNLEEIRFVRSTDNTDADHVDRLPSSAQRPREEPVPPAPAILIAQSAHPPSLSSSSSSVPVHAPSAIESSPASTGGTEVAIESPIASTGGALVARCHYHKSNEGCSGPVVGWIWMTGKSARPKARQVCASHREWAVEEEIAKPYDDA